MRNHARTRELARPASCARLQRQQRIRRRRRGVVLRRIVAQQERSGDCGAAVDAPAAVYLHAQLIAAVQVHTGAGWERASALFFILGE